MNGRFDIGGKVNVLLLYVPVAISIYVPLLVADANKETFPLEPPVSLPLNPICFTVEQSKAPLVNNAEPAIV